MIFMFSSSSYPVVCFHFSSLFKYKKTFNIILFFFIKCKYTAVIFRKSAAAYRYHRVITIQVITRIRLFQSLKILFLLLPRCVDDPHFMLPTSDLTSKKCCIYLLYLRLFSIDVHLKMCVIWDGCNEPAIILYLYRSLYLIIFRQLFIHLNF